MSLLSDLYQRVVELTNRLNAIGANSKTNEELPVFSPLNRNALVRGSVSGVSKTFTLQALIDEVATELALGNVPVVFMPVTINFNTTGTTQSKIIAKLNAQPNYVLQQGTLYIPYVQRLVLSNGIGIETPSGNFSVITEYYLLTQRIDPDVDGIASIGIDGTEIEANGVRYLNTVDSRSFAPVDFYLGDIASASISSAVDGSGPYSTPNGTTVLFHATQDGEERIWLYRGTQEEVGLTKPATDEEDYRLFPSEDETDPPPTYQETKPQGSSSLSSITLFLDNHETRYYKMESAFYQANFLTRRLRLGGVSRCLINTTGEEEYPSVKNKWLVRMNQGTGSANIVIDSNNYLIEATDTPTPMESLFVTEHAADILSDTGMSVIFNPDGYLEFDGIGSHTITISNVSGTMNGTVTAVPAVLINTPEFTEGLYDMFTEFDGKQINYWFRPRVIEGNNVFELYDYEDIGGLILGQSTQRKQAKYIVYDASADPNITFASGETKLQAEYRFNGVPTGSIDDYTLISAPYGNHTDSKPLVTADTATEITLYPFGNFCNSYVANLEDTEFTFVLTNEDAPAGESATVLIKTDSGASDFPTLADAEYVEGAPFEADAYFDLYAWHNGATVAYTFLSRSAPPPDPLAPDIIIIPDVIGDSSVSDWVFASSGTIPVGNGTISRTDNGGSFLGNKFGNVLSSEYTFEKWAVQFKIDSTTSGKTIQVNVAPKNVNIINGGISINSSTPVYTSVEDGDVIRIEYTVGLIEVFVNDVFADSKVVGLLTMDEMETELRFDGITSLSEIKQLVWTP